MIYIAPKKRAIPEAVRRAVAQRAGALGIGNWTASCHYCHAGGTIHWMTRCWVYFAGLELDHVVPEHRGGQATEDNIVLACQHCNRSKGYRKPVPA
jgi:5-methylcytosine-specific restriction endonuclease McrA